MKSNVKWIDVLENATFVRGTIPGIQDAVVFEKMSKEAKQQIIREGASYLRLVQMFSDNNSGCRISFRTDSNNIYVNYKVKREWSHAKLIPWGGLGLDVYKRENNQFIHVGVFGPAEDGVVGCQFELESIIGEYYIYLPTYTCVQELKIGIEQEKELYPAWEFEEILPIVFYGNSVTQGASACRSGNAIPCIVQRMMNRNIINLSFSGICLGQIEIAKQIGMINCKGIVLDYSRNEKKIEEFKVKYGAFYSAIREFHPYTKIVMLTAPNFSGLKEIDEYNNIITECFHKAYMLGENVGYVDVMSLFDRDEYDLLATDSCHMNDYGMYKVAEEIIKQLTPGNCNLLLNEQSCGN